MVIEKRIYSLKELFKRGFVYTGFAERLTSLERSVIKYEIVSITSLVFGKRNGKVLIKDRYITTTIDISAIDSVYNRFEKDDDKKMYLEILFKDGSRARNTYSLEIATLVSDDGMKNEMVETGRSHQLHEGLDCLKMLRHQAEEHQKIINYKRLPYL